MDMVAGLPGKGATSPDAPFCAVTVALGDVMEEIFFFNQFIVAGCCLPVFFCGAGYTLCC
jgi:hypothetical protein